MGQDAADEEEKEFGHAAAADEEEVDHTATDEEEEVGGGIGWRERLGRWKEGCRLWAGERI